MNRDVASKVAVVAVAAGVLLLVGRVLHMLAGGVLLAGGGRPGQDDKGSRKENSGPEGA